MSKNMWALHDVMTDVISLLNVCDTRVFLSACLFVQAPNLTLWVSSGQPLHLVSALSDDGSASGDLFWDDGESIETYENNQYAYITFSVAQVLTVCYKPPLLCLNMCDSVQGHVCR